ncbi:MULTISPECIES: glycosyltransferase family 4 protein [unclassified Nostoc]|uniref:glycosyltransferase family 4 protein n=1 Tax=unclassified Nostoc TaxID=2593658 RepID=UPI002AD1FA38|nr:MULTISPECIES: glycosyltransferase family 4 protein [unclassified Nostoc]MDZ8126977.1 glycosyltransferase family 4 protein [Nostoc sp. CmiVER01]MDZ8223209.1 glycosyltransferase family 4 protein [Nostoc sp. ChiVER01]
MNNQLQSTIALLHWGDLIEDFLDTIGVSFEAFCNEMTGGWMFGYISALKLAGVGTVLFCISARVTEPMRYTHKVTGATICVLPAPKIYHVARHHIPNPYAWNLNEAIGEIHGIHRILLAILKDISPYLATPLVGLARELRHQGCQAILCQEYEYARFDVCVLLGKLIGLPVFATFQGGDFQLSRWERPLRPLTVRLCAGLIVATQTEVQRVQSSYGIPSAKLARIFNPLDVINWQAIDRSEARTALDIPLNAQVVVCHGRIDIHRKGLDILLDAWKQVLSDRPERDLWLLLVGTGSDAAKLHQLIGEMQLHRVLWVDEYVRDRTVIQRYLSAADVYTLPSRHEGFPVALIEAMSCSLPVVATDAPGVPDILEGGEASGGLVVPRGDAMALALTLGRILDNQAWGRELGKLARCRVVECFSLEAIGKQLRDFLFS